MDKEQSAIDVIYQLLEKIEALDQKFTVMDQNIKLLNNKLNSIQKQPTNRPKGVQPQSSAIVGHSPTSSDRELPLVIGNIKTFGYIMKRSGGGQSPIPDVGIKIYNENGQVIKNAKSGQDGYWEVRLPPGKYGVEYVHGNFKPINKVIELDSSMSKFEVK